MAATRSPSRGSSAQDALNTPEVLRRDASASSQGGRPGESSPSKRSGSSSRAAKEAKAPSKFRAHMRRCGTSLAYVPWLALMALALMVAGVVLFALKAKEATGAATDLLTFLGSPTSQGWPSYMKAWDSSIWATVGVAGATCAFVVFGAAVRLDQRLRKAGKYSTAKGAYGPHLFRFYTFLSWLGTLLVVLLALWAVINGMLLAGWAVQCWNLEQGAEATTASMTALSTINTHYAHTVADFASTINSLPQAAAQAAPEPVEGNPTATVKALAVPAPAPAPATAAGGEESVVALLASLQRYGAMFAEVSEPANITQQAGLCPSAACLNMALYPFTESPACVCTVASTQSLSALASTAVSSARWALFGAAALCAGAVLGSLELAADTSLLRADQLFLKVIKRRSSRSSSSRTRQEGERSSSFSALPQMLSPQHTLPGKTGSAYQLQAHALG